MVNVEPLTRDVSHIDDDFEYWFARTCVPDVLTDARRQPLHWEGRPLAWEVCHEILAFQRFCGGRYAGDRLVELSNTRYALLDALWPGGSPTREQLDTFYIRSAEILPWGHGVFQADHHVAARRENWLRRVRLLMLLRRLGVDSLLDYGAGGGHTSLLARAMGFGRVVHHEYAVYHPYVEWRAGHIAPPACFGARSEFVLTDAARPLALDGQVQAVTCTDVAEHVFSPDELLEEVHRVLEPGGVLVWVSMFGDGGISCHLHGHLAGREEALLAGHGFRRISDLPCVFQGHTGVYESVAVRSRIQSDSNVAVLPVQRSTGYPPLEPLPLGPDFAPRVVDRDGADVLVGLGHLRLRLRPDRYLDAGLIDGHLFESTSLGLLARLILPGQTVVDVGANFGYYSLLLSRWVGETGTVVAFEPTREYGQRLEAHLQENDVANVRFERLGLSDRDRAAAIDVGECSGTMHWTAPTPPRATETVRLVRFDDWWSRYVAEGHTDSLNFVKIDVDGHELRVLRGARETIVRHRPILLLEFYMPNLERAGCTCDDLADFVEHEIGYVIYSETTGLPFGSRQALLAEVERPDRSFNVLCLPGLQRASLTESSAGPLFTKRQT